MNDRMLRRQSSFLSIVSSFMGTSGQQQYRHTDHARQYHGTMIHGAAMGVWLLADHGGAIGSGASRTIPY